MDMAENPHDFDMGDGERNLVEDAACLPQSDSQTTPAVAPPAPDPNHRERDALGRFLPLHVENVTTGLSLPANRRLPPHLEFIRQEVERFEAGQLADEGESEADIPTRRRSELRYRTFIHRNILGVAAALEHKGIFDKHGKLRLQWLGKIESLINTAVRLDGLLGLDRRRKDLNTMDVSEILAAVKRERGGGEHDHVHAHSDEEKRETSEDSDEGDLR